MIFSVLLLVISVIVELREMALCGLASFVFGMLMILASGGSTVPDIEAEMKAKNNISLEDVKIIDSGDIFKYDDNYYIRTKDKQVLLIDRRYSNKVYEHE